MLTKKIIFLGCCLALSASAASWASAPKEEKQMASRQQVEVQAEFGKHRLFSNRHINDYTLQIYQRFRQNGSVSLYKGLTFERGVGHTTDDGIRRDSNAIGLGPAFMWRWQHAFGHSKWYGAIEGKGSILAYNRAFPADGRAFGFQWAIGPRIGYQWNPHQSLSLAYLMKHNSNGFHSHNPGYNTVGFSLAYTHQW